MFTLAVIIFDVIALLWSGSRILKRSKAVKYTSGKLLGWGLVGVGVAILLYGIRSVVVQFGPSYYWMDEKLFYRPGTVIHSLSLFIIFLFVYKEFAPKLFAKITALPVLGSMLYMAVLFAVAPTNRKVAEAPLEPVKFVMTNYPWASSLIAQSFLFITVGVPLIILGVFLYSGLKSEKVKSFLFGVGTPVVSFLGIVGLWKPDMLPFHLNGIIYKILFALAIISLFVAVLVTKEKKAMVKTVLYGLGVAFQCLFIPLCIFISPIFARLGYGIGAFMVYKAFGIKVKKKA